MATAAMALVLTGMSSSRMRCRSFPAIFEDSTDSPAAVALIALMIVSTGALLSM